MGRLGFRYCTTLQNRVTGSHHALIINENNAFFTGQHQLLEVLQLQAIVLPPRRAEVRD